MPAVFTLTFSPSERVQKLYGSRGDWYEWEDGARLGVRSKPVYCHQCGDFTDGESIETVAEITQQIADLKNPQSDLFRFVQGNDATTLGAGGIRFLMDLEQRQKWITRRSSPPKCLECGSIDFVEFPEGQQIPDPTGPGRVVLTVTGLCSTWFNNRFYTPEGDRITRDTKPTYWTLP